VNVPELRIPIRVTGTFFRFLIPLKAVAQLIQQAGYRLTANSITLFFQGRRQLTGAQASPAQWVLRIASGRRFNQSLQGRQQPRLPRRQLFATATHFPKSIPLMGRRIRGLPYPFTVDRGPRKTGGFGHDTLPPITQGFRFCRCPHPTTALVQHLGNALKFLAECFDDILSSHADIIVHRHNLFHLFLDRL
jgi:hypothetical protein